MKKILFLVITLLFIFSCTKQIDKQKEQTETISTSGDSYKKVISGLRGREGVSDIELLLNEGGINAQDTYRNATPLMTASMLGYTDLVNALIKDGAYVNATDSEAGTTALMTAITAGFSDIVDILIENGAYVNIGRDKVSPLYMAAFFGKESTVESLLKAGATVGKSLQDKDILEMIDNDSIEEMLKNAQEPNKKTSDSLQKELVNVRGREGVSDIQALLDEGGINAYGLDNNATPLILSSKYGYLDLVNALIKDGAYVNAAADDGITALMMASYGGYADVVQSLIDNGAYINIASGIDEGRATPLLLSVMNNKSDVVDILLKEKASDVGFNQLEESDIERIDKNIKNMLSKSGIDIGTTVSDVNTTDNNIGENGIVDYELVGLIDNKYPITMSLTIDKDGNASGTYYYDKQKKDILINGSVNYNELRLNENVDGKITGEFIGTFDSDNMVYKGNWINASTQNSMPFMLTQKGATQNNVALEKLVGTFKDEYGTEVELILKGTAQMYINGMVVSGTGNMGELNNFVLGYNNGELVYTDDDYKLVVKILDKDNIKIEETNPHMIHGMGAGFDGTYKKIK